MIKSSVIRYVDWRNVSVMMYAYIQTKLPSVRTITLQLVISKYIVLLVMYYNIP